MTDEARKALADELDSFITLMKDHRFSPEALGIRARNSFLFFENMLAALRSQPGTLAREDLRAVLKEHWLTHIKCNHEARTDQAFCYCTELNHQPMPSLGEAVDMWIEHVIPHILSLTPSHEAGTQAATKKTYLKPFRTIVELDVRYADRIRDLLNVAPEAGTQEPVAWTNEAQLGFLKSYPDVPFAMWASGSPKSDIPLYAAPQPASIAQAARLREALELIQKQVVERGSFTIERNSGAMFVISNALSPLSSTKSGGAAS